VPGDGVTVSVVPVATLVPPQLPLYQFQLPPVPNEPPLKVNVVLWPLQMVVFPLIDVAGTEVSLTVTVND
jgi:hypothetical protein